jgi:hypothetical protein
LGSIVIRVDVDEYDPLSVQLDADSHEPKKSSVMTMVYVLPAVSVSFIVMPSWMTSIPNAWKLVTFHVPTS